MMHKTSECVGCAVQALDGEVGEVVGLCLDDVTWSIRHLVVKLTRTSGRTVLLSLDAVQKPDWTKRVIPVGHTMEQVGASPVLDDEALGPHPHEAILHQHYLWPLYWLGGVYELPALAQFQPGGGMVDPGGVVERREPHLRGLQEVLACRVHAVDGLLGAVQDILFDDESWGVRYLVVNLQAWLPRRLVLVSPRWITRACWAEHELQVDLTREIIRTSPRVRVSEIGTPAYEEKLLGHLEKAPAKEWILFRLHAAPGLEVHVTGSFNQWHPTAIRMGEVRRGVYTAMLLLPSGRYEYKFVVDGAWVNGPSAAGHVPNPFGTTNNVLLVGRHPGHPQHLHTFARTAEGDTVMLAHWNAE